MNKKYKIIFISSFIILLFIIYYNRQSYYSSFVSYKVQNLDIVKDYIGDDKMDIVGENYASSINNIPAFMQLDNNVSENRKKISVQYYCNMLCDIYAVALDKGENVWEIVYGNKTLTGWIENWGK